MPQELTDAQRIDHLIDDRETIRTHPIRTIQHVQPLISNALVALAAGDLDVVKEFLERVDSSLVAEDKWLRQCGNVL